MGWLKSPSPLLYYCGFLAATTAILGFVSAEVKFKTASPYVGQKWTTVPNALALLLDEAGDVLVMSSNGLITSVYDKPNRDGTVVVYSRLILNGTSLGLNYGITYSNGFLYASSATTVYRWPYVPGSRKEITGEAQPVVIDMPKYKVPVIQYNTNGRNTRPLIFDKDGRIYVDVLSKDNTDKNPDRSLIRRFDLRRKIALPLVYNNGDLFAQGLRSTAGLGFDPTGVLWGTENGVDNLFRQDLGGDIHDGNPADELNRFSEPLGSSYGFPYCFTSYSLKAVKAGTQFAMPEVLKDGTHTDSWCRDPKNNRPPVLPFRAHEAPVSIEFYKGATQRASAGSFPNKYKGQAFIAFYGTLNSDFKVGFRVARYVFKNSTSGFLPTGENENIIFEPSPQTCTECFRAVNAIFDFHGHLIVTTESGDLFRVYYNAKPPRVVGRQKA